MAIDLERELIALKRRVSILQWLTGGLAAGLAIALSVAFIGRGASSADSSSALSGRGHVQETVIAKEFYLVDAEGKALGAWVPGKGGNPFLAMFGKEGAKVSLGFLESRGDFPWFAMHDIAGKKRLSMTVSRNELDGAGMSLFNNKEDRVFSLAQGGRYGTSLQFADPDTPAFLQAGVISGGRPYVELAGKDGRIFSRLPGTQ